MILVLSSYLGLVLGLIIAIASRGRCGNITHVSIISAETNEAELVGVRCELRGRHTGPCRYKKNLNYPYWWNP